MYSLLQVSVTVNIIKQTVQYMDMTCSVLQYGIQYCVQFYFTFMVPCIVTLY